MSKELGGYGPTAGTNVGGTGANLNERPDNSKPGGGSHGNSGGQHGDNTNSSNSVNQQISAIQNDPKIKQKLIDMLLAARKMNPAAKMTLGSISPSGVMQVGIDGITADQARQIGLGDLL